MALKFLGRAAALALFLSALAAPAMASFEAGFRSAQSEALGRSSLPSARDSTALFVNPGGLAGLSSPEAYFSYYDMYSGLGVGAMNAGFLTAAVPSPLGTFGVGVGVFRAEGLLSERTVSVGFARTIWGGAQVGIAAKHLYHTFNPGGDPLAAGDPIFSQGTSKGAVGVDLGAVVPLMKPFTLGVAVRNINRPDVGLALEDRLPREFQVGLGFDAFGLRANTDLSWLNDDTGNFSQPVPSVGLEKSLHEDRFAFRVGLTPRDWSAGFGVNWGSFGFDYAFVLRRELLRDNMGTHRVGLRLRFGSAK